MWQTSLKALTLEEEKYVKLEPNVLHIFFNLRRKNSLFWTGSGLNVIFYCFDCNHCCLIHIPQISKYYLALPQIVLKCWEKRPQFGQCFLKVHYTVSHPPSIHTDTHIPPPPPPLPLIIFAPRFITRSTSLIRYFTSKVFGGCIMLPQGINYIMRQIKKHKYLLFIQSLNDCLLSGLVPEWRRPTEWQRLPITTVLF